FQTVIFCHKSNCLSLKRLRTSVTPALALLILLTPNATSSTYSLSLHDALPISPGHIDLRPLHGNLSRRPVHVVSDPYGFARSDLDRKSTRLNSSHLVISYAVFCLIKKISLILPFFCPLSPSPLAPQSTSSLPLI